MNQVHLIDCMEFMQSLPDQHYDLAITDPPYGIGADVKNSSNEKAGKSSIVTRTHYGNQRWDDAVPSKEYFIELKRVSRRQIVWGVNYYPYSDIFAGGRLFWDKGVSMPSFSAGELAYLSFINSIDLVKITWDGMRQHNMRDKEHRIHPTQKPVALYSWLLAKYAEGGGTVFDSHVGSGSIRIACHDLGINFEGCEIDPDYWRAQEDRYSEHIAQPTLFKPALPSYQQIDIF